MPALSGAGGDRRASVAGVAAVPGANTTSVKVVVRIRPNIGSDAANVPPRFQRIVVHPVSETTLSADNAGAVGAGAGPASPAAGPSGRAAKQLFTFDRVIAPTEGQPDVWDCAEPLVDSFLEGFNATILAYGQTSSGKSYTMGTDRMNDGILGDVERQGITPRAVTEIFDRLAASQRDSKGGLTFSAKVSYLEIYNEELIDLLAGNRDERPTVQIREDKQGNIFWSGLHEVKVSSAHEVMDLLAAGSALRQTGETQMNAQSSRSHAILSLTVTQRKRTGSAPPTPSFPAMPSSPPSPQHNRRLSAIPRVSSPVPAGRSGTPTFDRPGSRVGLRPPSQLGRPASPQDSEGGTWVNVTSKFRFVDLAGSERLKRTAATGDRAKEAVSINAGLSALGNVISALGDPTKKATHVPYRDSKLTRLLQDSLGGNARTMMVACVSPTEFNLQETLSTLKYANRARNIKNRAEINETEAGWDDLEHLQRTIVKLRAEMAALKSGDVAHVVDRNGHAEVAVPGSVEAELQQKIAHLTAELAKAQSGDFVAPGSPSSSSLSRDQFAAAVEPIVEEYERSLSALESQLALTKAALGHSEDEMRDLEARIEEETRTNEANAALIDDLRLRVAKLSEREETTEQYVRDLESRLKDVDDADESHGVAISDLRKELSRNREAAQSTDLYIKELEGRLAQADEANADLRRQIEALEREVARREESYRELEARVTLLDTSHDSKLLLAEIDDKDRRLHDLERAVDELKGKVGAAEEEAQRLQKLASEEKAVKEELLGRVRTLERTRNLGPTMTPPRTPGSSSVESGSPEAAEVAIARDAATEAFPSPADGSSAGDNLRQQIASLQATHEQTLRDLKTAQQKYRDSLKEIDDLNGQIQESQLLQSRRSESDFSESGSQVARGRVSGEADEGGDALEELAESPTSTRTGSPVMQRSAPRTPHARRSMPLSPQRLSFLGRGQGASSPSHLRSASLAQELSSAVFSQTSCPTSPHTVSPSSSSHIRRDSFFGQTERSSEQMKEEVLKLQSTLNERDAEIAALEATVQQLRTPDPSSAPSPLHPAGMPLPSIVTERPATPPPGEHPTPPSELLLSPRTQSTFDSLRADLNGTGLGFVALGAPAHDRSDQQDQSRRLDELMRSMAHKESVHRETVEQLQSQLEALQKQHDELAVLSRDQVLNASTEVDRMREAKEAAEAGRLALERDLADKAAEVERLQGELASAATRAEQAAKEALGKLDAEVASARKAAEAAHRDHLVSLAAEHAKLIKELEAGHATALRDATFAHKDELRSKDSAHASALEELAAQHAEALRLRDVQHADDLRVKLGAAATDSKAQVDALLEQVRQLENQLDALSSAGQADVAAAIEKLSAEHASTLAEHVSAAERERQALRDEHETKLREREAEHDVRLRQLVDDHAQLTSRQEAASGAAGIELEAARQQHADELERIRREHDKVIQTLRGDHETALQSRETERTDALDQLRAEHATALAESETNHSAALSAQQDENDARLRQAAEQQADLVSTHEAALHDAAEKLEQARQERVAELERVEAEQAIALQALRDEHEQSSKLAADSHASELEDVKRQYSEAIAALESKHVGALELARSDLAAQHASTVDEVKLDLQRQLDQAKAEHSAALEALRAEHDAVRSASTADSDKARQFAEELEAARTSHAEEKERLIAEHSAEVERLLAEHEALRLSLGEAHKTALDDERAARENALEQAKVEYAIATETLRASLTAQHADALASLSREHEGKLASLASNHDATLVNLRADHDAEVQRLRDEHSTVLQDEATKTQNQLDEAAAAHASALAAVAAERDAAKQAVDSIRTELAGLQDELAGARDAAAAVSTERDSLAQRLDELSTRHANLVAEHAKELNSLRQSIKVQQAVPSTTAAPETQIALASLASLEQAVHESQADRARLVSEIRELRGGEDGVALDDSRFESMLKEVEQYRAVVTKLDAQLVLTRKEKDTLAAQLARMSLSSGNAGLGISSVQSPPSDFGSRAMSPTSDLDRATSPPLRSERFFSNGSTFSGKFPPPTPPPSVPPPPAPAPTSPLPPVPAGGSPLRLGGRRSSASSTATAATEHRRGSLGGSGESSIASQAGDAKLAAQVNEHEAQLARLKQQLAQRNADYQAQVDLVSTLESALNDSERNLRKARLQSNEYARERDQHKATVDRLRQEAQDSHTTSESYRQSVLDMEERLQEQRTREARAERARMELEARMEAASKRKSKFACF
ncbi:hypothetical protein NBRC10513_004783 [Rhodotorula toruloides]|uniref:BY PROTMAP: gi/472587622/gb/EMS25118.1/ kinesin family member 4/7/21/27 [Rhodosporidium toruloides NP11] gi/647398671/emb/CDR42794.1/ RHTO0S07e04192g1_1 [Rhodosporidium toruloides] n=1 Tax=Rhodotorula toruloides TaxID=5286 RepID=A0A0K3CKY8_RHOTO|nr:hypothetical protein AAT19DRAFT_15224 [Rhodotorula toruloides]